ncbi:MAG: caspase family protein [Calditrichaeota bacterium]|nr:caspase family protein [Calditrichota bacterium]
MKLGHRITSAVSIILILLFPLETAFAQTSVYLTGNAAEEMSGKLPEWIIDTKDKKNAEWILTVNRYVNPAKGDPTFGKIVAVTGIAGGLIGGIASNGTLAFSCLGLGIFGACIADHFQGWYGCNVTLSDLRGGKTLIGSFSYELRAKDVTHRPKATNKLYSKMEKWIIKKMQKLRNDKRNPTLHLTSHPSSGTYQSIIMIDVNVFDDIRLGELNATVNGKKLDRTSLLDMWQGPFEKKFSIPLDIGPNNIILEVSDWCGRKTTKTLSVFRSRGSGTEPPDIPISPESYPPLLTISNVEFYDETKDDFLDAGEGGVLSFSIENSGRGEARELEISINADPESGIAVSESRFPKSVQANESINAEATLIASATIPTASTTIELSALDKPTNSPADPVSFEIKTRGRWSDVDLKIPKGRGSNRDGIAIIIGNGNYTGRGVYPVDFALQDAETIMKYVKETLRFDKDNILFETDVTLSELRSIFGTEVDSRGKLYNMVRPDVSDVFIFYSGHGAPGLGDEQGYILPVNVSAEDAQMNGYSLELLTKNVSKIPAKSITVVMDACFTGFSEGGFMIPNASPGAIRIKYPHLQIPNGSFFLAAECDQIASWYPEMKHGLFTYFFLKGMKGEADKNRDKKITAAELQRYLEEEVPYKVRRLVGRDQQPEIILSNPDRVIVQY